MKVFIVLGALVLLVTSKLHNVEDLIDEINTSQNLWIAAPNHITARGYAAMKKLLGSKKISHHESDVQVISSESIPENSVPAKFDARKKWPKCPSIDSVKDQSDCGSCWAVSTASAMSDRLCIASKFKVRVNISAENLMCCCSECGYGCDGGYPEKAWDYFRYTGIVTGGDYGTKDGCQPYEIEPCGDEPTIPLCPAVPPPTPQCYTNKCTNKKYKKNYNKDLHHGSSTYVFTNNLRATQLDIMNHGPNVAIFSVYEDFFLYKSGIYKYTSGGYLGGHAVRILGWGTEKGTDYWLVANSWNRTWGENGFFRIIRGTNDCGFESYINAGLVKPK